MSAGESQRASSAGRAWGASPPLEARAGARVVVKLSGGLGNQMFQYANAYAVARRNGLGLAVDGVSGFARDRVYGRQYQLDVFPIEADAARPVDRLPFGFELLMQRAFRQQPRLMMARWWGTFIREERLSFHPELLERRLAGRVWIDGYWQSERYFADFASDIARQFNTPSSNEAAFVSLARQMESCNSVAVGVRMFEEAPGGAGHWAAPLSSYLAAARALELSGQTFFVFCTKRSLVEGRLSLPGPVVIVAGDDGFGDALSTFWLMQRCATFIISNSTFYWWAAWLAERARPGTRIAAIDNFPHKNAIPDRWLAVPRDT